MRKIIATCIAVCGITLGAVLLPTAAAHAATIAVACAGSGTATYNPGITLEQQTGTVKFTEDISCTQTLPLPLTVLTASALDSFTAQYSCLSLLGGRTGSSERTYHWSTGDTSVFTFSTSVQRLAAQTVITETGLIEAGRYDGATAVHVLTLTNLQVTQCLQPGGVKSLTGPTTFTLTAA